jgi:hypothetical protein
MFIKYDQHCYTCGANHEETQKNPDCGSYLTDHYFSRNIIFNLTPHEINIVLENETINIPSDGILRVAENSTLADTFMGIPVITKTFGNIIGYDLPKEANLKNTIYIVSLPVAQALKGMRNDIYITNDPVRNDKGQIIGCRSLGIL